MSLATRLTFDLLLRRFRPGVIADVGSRDGLEARRFAAARPDALVLAFEANPANVERMQADPDLASTGVRIVPRAVGSHSGSVTFYVLEAGPEDTTARGMSSLLPRVDGAMKQLPVTVDCVRLDEYLALERPEARIALWVDVEGAAQEVITGIEGIRGRVDFLHVELEHHGYWEGQALAPAVVSAMVQMGFEVLGSIGERSQEDVVFVRRELYEAHRVQLRAFLLVAQLAEAVKMRLNQSQRRLLRRGLARLSRLLRPGRRSLGRTD